MKKNLLRTTAFVGMVMSLAAGNVVAAGQAPTLTMSGSAKFQAYGYGNSKNSGNYLSSPNTNSGPGYLFTQTGEIAFVVAGVAKNGLEYNYTIVLNAAPGPNSSGTISENRIEFKGRWGTVQLGAKIGPEDVLMTDAVNVLGATGGFDGDWTNAVTQTSGVFTGDSMRADTGNATKIAYYTPRFSGFMLGVGFTPSNVQSGTSSMQSSATSSSQGARDSGILSAGLNFAHEFNNGLGLSLTAAGISASNTKVNPNGVGGSGGAGSGTGNPSLKARKSNGWQLGGLMNYKNFQFGLGYINNNKTGTYTNANSYDGGSGWSTALGYTFGINKVAVGYQGTRQKNGTGSAGGVGKADIFSLTGDRTLAPGLGVYAEYDYISQKIDSNALAGLAANSTVATGTPTSSNKSNLVIIGAKISF